MWFSARNTKNDFVFANVFSTMIRNRVNAVFFALFSGVRGRFLWHEDASAGNDLFNA